MILLLYTVVHCFEHLFLHILSVLVYRLRWVDVKDLLQHSL